MPFKNIKSYGSDGISNLLELNLRYWAEDSFMRIGSIIPERTSVLHPDTSNDVINLMVWNSNVQSWAPRRMDGNNIVITPATVTVNGVTEPNVTINYSKGQVTFTRELLPDDIVEARHYTNRLNIATVLELNRRPMIQLGLKPARAILFFYSGSAESLAQPPTRHRMMTSLPLPLFPAP